jgi:hypothetical protein
MNDDFLKRHWQRPDPKFVDRLSIQLNSTPQRSIPMSTRILRPVLLVTLALFLAFALTLTFSPAARAAVQAIFTFNDVTVSIDDETGALIASGNTDAIVQQTDNSVTIRGEDGSMAGVVVADASVEMLGVAELLERYPDLVLPQAPEGYTLAAQGQLSNDGTLTFTWTSAAGQMITYVRSPSLLENVLITGMVGGEAVSSNQPYPAVGVIGGTGPALEFPQGGLEMLSAGATLTAGYVWETGGYLHLLSTTDPELSEVDLQAMQP